MRFSHDRLTGSLIGQSGLSRCLAGLIFWTSLLVCAAVNAESQSPAYPLATQQNVPRQVFWGDTHVHTNNSADAFTLGTKRMSPSEAYRFARGEALESQSGIKVQLRRPLDFLAVADHAEYLGVFAWIREEDPAILATEIGQRWHRYMQAGEDRKMFDEFVELLNVTGQGPIPEQFQLDVWRSVAETADRFNDPGRFTAFAAYEWTSNSEGDRMGNNLHRVVLFRDGAELTANGRPFSSLDSKDPEDLWRAMSAYEEATGGAVLAIPHNGNLSNGAMFAPATLSGEPLDRAYAETRMRWEPIFEVTQIKGDSEAHPVLSPEDEFADYETWDKTNIMNNAEKEDWMLQYEYARSALKIGLSYEQALGANPFKFGMIGSTDSHTSLSTPYEDKYFGKYKGNEPRPDRAEYSPSGFSTAGWMQAASGLAAVWARENTREALFAAMKRKEVYATTGSRIMVRFFGGWDYPVDADVRPDYVDIGYRRGVPMGGDLTGQPAGKVPTFIVVAAKDPDEANLDRIQIVKGWLESDGNLQEKIYDVALSGGRIVDPETGTAPGVGSTVSEEDTSYTNTIGEPYLSVTWTDPDFDPAERAFYYARVIEIPKPRWTAYDAKAFDLDLPDKIPMVTQDRAYTSPIWYTPGQASATSDQSN